MKKQDIRSRQDYVKWCREQFEELKTKARYVLYYLNAPNGTRKGLLFAFKYEGSDDIYVGASFTNPKDQFNKYVGISQAYTWAMQPGNTFRSDGLSEIINEWIDNDSFGKKNGELLAINVEHFFNCVEAKFFRKPEKAGMAADELRGGGGGN